MSSSSPAADAALSAMSAVGRGDRAAWLACYAEDAVLHDPVGGSPLDPEGLGLRGAAAREQLWDLTIAPNDVHVDVSAVHTGADEAAVVATVTIRFASGPETTYDGVFVYRVRDDGKIASVRSYFDLQRVMEALTA
jgi:steroid Delta-isomerase